jgi:hypothetical protein
MAIVPVFYGFMVKSALQTGSPIPAFSMKTALWEGMKAAPTIGLIVGTQMVAQNLAEKGIMQLTGNTEPQFISMLASSILVGAVSAAPLAVFNGMTMKQTARESLSSLTARQALAIVARETSFLFSLRISGPVGEVMKENLGDSRAVKVGAAFTSGAIGSLIGHPADTALTLWQKKQEIRSARQLMNGGAAKAVTVGVFTICYGAAKELIESTAE